MLQFVADNDFKTAIDPILFQSVVRPMGAHAEAQIAASRMTPEGRRFPGVTPALQSALGVPKLPKTGAWSVVQRPEEGVPAGSGEAVPVSETKGRPGRRTTRTSSYSTRPRGSEKY